MNDIATIPTVADQIDAIRQQNALSLLPAPMKEMREAAQMMAAGAFMVPAYFRGEEDACFAIVYQATRWGLDPVAVANKAYIANNRIGYEAQLVASLVNTRAPLVGRTSIRYGGEGSTRYCEVRGRLAGATEDAVVCSPTLAQIKPKNSPLWHSDPDQQLAYYTQRAWARRHCPEVLLGIYTDEEVKVMSVVDVTPRQLASAYDDDAVELEEVEGVLMAEGETAGGVDTGPGPEIVVEAEPLPPIGEPSGGHGAKVTTDSQGKGAVDLGPDPWADIDTVEGWYEAYRKELGEAPDLPAFEKLAKQAKDHGWLTKLGQAEGRDGPMRKTLNAEGAAKRAELTPKEG